MSHGIESSEKSYAQPIGDENFESTGNNAEGGLDWKAGFRAAEEGWEKTPDEIFVEDIGEIVQDTGLSPDALEAYRISHSTE